MADNIFCPVCGMKICETVKSKDLKVKCKKCKSGLTINKDESELRIQIIDRNTDITTN